MPRFAYRALGQGGRLVEGQIVSGTQERAVEQLRRRRLAPLSIEEMVGNAGILSFLGGASARAGATRPGALLDFTRDLQVLLDAGVPLGRALRLLADSAAGATAALARRLLARIEGGASLSAAMESDPDIFPGHYVGMVRAGEEGSTLAAVLARLATMLERSAALRSQIRSGLAYPVLVLCLAGITMLLLLVVVIPEFQPVFEQTSGDFPFATRALIWASDVSRKSGWAIAAGLLAFLLLVRQAGRRDGGRRLRDWIVLRLPLIGALVVKIETARFCRTLGTLVANDVVLVDAARIATGTIANRHLALPMRAFVAGLTHGDDVLASLRRAGWLPRRALQMIAVGVESGRFGEILLRVADIYEAEAASATGRAVGLIAPVTTLLLGGLIGLMMWSVITTVLGSYSQALG